MKLPTSTSSRSSGSALKTGAFPGLLMVLALLLSGVNSAAAKDAPAAAVVLYDGPQGVAYVQITGPTLNGKADVRVCEGVAKFDRNAYENFPRVNLAGATSLQRGTEGVLTLTVNAKPVCIVPNGLKFDKKPELTSAEAADQAVLQGVAVSSSTQDLAIPSFKAGVQLVFIAAPDTEQADYLRAQRANSVGDWQDFVTHHPSSTHLPEVRNSIAGIHEQAADAAFAQYQKSSAAHKTDLAALRQASIEAQAASKAAAGYSPATKLMDAITHELDGLAAPDRGRLQAFQKALPDHGSGYPQLVAARQHLELLVDVRPDYAPLVNLLRDVAGEERKLEGTVTNAESLVAASRYDDAITSLGSYSAFAPEIPGVEAIIAAAYKFHFENGQRLGARQDWEQSAAEFRKAVAIHPDSKEADAALKNATAQLAAERDQQEANLAILQSNEYTKRNQLLEAYNVLAELPDSQRALVKSQLSALASQYVPLAARRAQKLQEVHLPIKDRADEDALREAYVLLNRASSASGDPAITLKRDFLSNKISAYYLDQASRYLEKPSGSGAGVGWLYLNEAQRYGVTNVNALKDQMAQYASLYQRRARLSVGIVLRDQTSRRDSPGFADQLADAIANGLDASGVSIEIVRKPGDSGDALQPNFTLVGEVLEHRVTKNANLETPPSRYRAGTHDVKNPEWVQANSDYESAQQQLAAAQRAVADAQAQHRKKEIVAVAADAVLQAQKHADELKRKLESIEQNRVEVIVEPYHYTKKTLDLTAAIDLAFRISDRSGNAVGAPVTVHKDSHKTSAVVQDVRPEDTEGVTNQGIEPDETQFLSDLEVEARNALIKAVREKAAALPGRVLQEARGRAQRGDLDGAAEQYVMYLNATPEVSSPERGEAAKFLHDRFNLSAPLASKL